MKLRTSGIPDKLNPGIINRPTENEYLQQLNYPKNKNKF